MGAVRDLQGFGTPERVWAEAGVPDHLDVLDWEDLLPEQCRVVIVVPHPDDEVLGLGGVLQELARRGVPVLLVGVTEGEASHAGREEELRKRRAAERRDALSLLGSDAHVLQLGHADGKVNEVLLRFQLEQVIEPQDLVLAPWSHDGHPDHDSCGRAAADLGRRTCSYLVWAWHWATPETLPLHDAVRVQLSSEDLARKRRAVLAFVSQLEGDDPILPDHVTARLLRTSEVLMLR